MDIKQLRYFVAVVDHKSYSRAAEAIPISQPSITRSIQALEQETGACLLDRSTRGLTMTSAGECLYRRAKLILSEVEQATSELRETRAAKDTVKIGVAPLFADNLMPSIVRAVAYQDSKQPIEVKSALFGSLLQGLQEGELDGIFTNLPFSPFANDLIVEPLVDIQLTYVCSANHPLAGTKASLVQLTAFPWAVVDEKNANELYDYLFASEGLANTPIMVKTNSLTMLRNLIQEPPYISLLPHHLIKEDIRLGQLCALDTPSGDVQRKGGLIYRKNRIASPPREMVFECIRDVCQNT